MKTILATIFALLLLDGTAIAHNETPGLTDLQRNADAKAPTSGAVSIVVSQNREGDEVIVYGSDPRGIWPGSKPTLAPRSR